MLAHVADEFEEAEIFHPVVVVDEFGCVRRVAVEVEEFCKLALDGFLVVTQGFLVDEFALLSFHGRIAYHARGASDECQRLVAGALQVLEHHDSHEVAYVQAVGGGVDAEIRCGHAFFEFFVGSGHELVYHAAPCEFFYKVHMRNFQFSFFEFPGRLLYASSAFSSTSSASARSSFFST